MVRKIFTMLIGGLFCQYFCGLSTVAEKASIFLLFFIACSMWSIEDKLCEMNERGKKRKKIKPKNSCTCKE